MKKKTLFTLLIITLFYPSIVLARNEKIEVTLAKCTDGDTASFNYNGEVIKARFLAIDTPESVHPTIGEEPYGKEASEYTCNALTNANQIMLEFDPNSDELDKYDRYLVWVYVDNKLLQKELVNNGLAKVAYLYNDYLYTSELEQAQATAQTNQIGIWGDYVAPKDYTWHYIIGGVVILLLLALIIPNLNNKTVKKYAKKGNTKVKRELKKNLNKLLK